MNLLLRKILLLLVFGLLLFPFAQQQFEFFSEKPLQGSFVAANNAVMSVRNWFSGEYQAQKEKYINENFGARKTAVRLRNQIDFALFSKVNATEFIAGKQGCIYAKSYLDAYTGEDFIGADSIAHRMQRLKFVQEVLAKKNKTLIFVLATGKASFFPEYFPSSYSNAFVQKNNYNLHVKCAKEQGLNYIDFNSYFVAHKSSSKYPIYPVQYGIHWSEYAMTLVMDSLVKYIEHQRNIDVPNFYFDKVVVRQAKGTDIDIVAPLNLLYFSNTEQLAYPYLKIQSSRGKTKPKVMAIGDSFYATLHNKGFAAAFSYHHFWYYNNSLVDLTPQGNPMLEDEINGSEIVILMATEANLKDVGWGFIDAAYDLYAHGAKPYYDVFTQRVASMAAYIKSDAKWVEAIQKKADERSISLDSAIYLDAKWSVEEDMKKGK